MVVGERLHPLLEPPSLRTLRKLLELLGAGRVRPRLALRAQDREHEWPAAPVVRFSSFANAAPRPAPGRQRIGQGPARKVTPDHEAAVVDPLLALAGVCAEER